MVSLGATLVIGVDAADAPMPHRSHPLPDGCRLSETMQAFGAVLDDPMMERFLQSGILGNLRREFDKHRPMLAILDGWERRGRNSSTTHMDLVKHAAGVVYDWLSDEGPAVLGFLQVLSIGGISYSVNFSDAVDRCASGIEGMTITKAQYQAMVVSSEYVAVDAMLEDGVPTLVDAIQQRQSALGPYDVALRRYECRVGNARVEFFSEFRSMDSYRQGVAGSRHAETILASSQAADACFGDRAVDSDGALIEQRQCLRRYEHVAPQVLSPDGVGNAGVEFYGAVDAMLEDCAPTLVDADCSGEADSSVEADSSSFGSLLAAAAAIE
jgi:hypothetical protein